MGIIILALRFEGGSWKAWEACVVKREQASGLVPFRLMYDGSNHTRIDFDS